MPDTVPWLAALPHLTERMRAEVEAAYRHGLMECPQPVVLTDLDGQVLAVNAEFERMTGYHESDVHGMPVHDLAHDEDRTAVAGVVDRLRAGATRREDYEARWVRRDGRVVWSGRHVFRVDDDVARRSYLVAVIEDRTAEHLAKRLSAGLLEVGRLIARGAPLSETMGRLAAIAEARWSQVGAMLTLLDEHRDALVPVVHEQLPDGFVDLLGAIPASADGGACGAAVARNERVAIADLRSDPRAQRIRAAVEQFAVASAWAVPVTDPLGHRIGAFTVFHKHRREPTAHDWHAIEQLAGIAGLAVYVDAERRRRDQQEQALRRDPLTQLPNTLAFIESIEAACRGPHPLTVALVRLHDLAALSSALGDDVASAALSRLAERAAALGGVRSVALVGPTSLAVAAGAAWTDAEGSLLRRVLSRPLAVGALTVRPDVRIGVAVKQAEDTMTPETLLRQATTAVPDAGSATYDPGVAVERVSRFALASDVPRALRRGEFVLHYQPRYDLRSGHPSGSEALVRWQHPERGLLTPGDFLRAVEIAAAGPDLALYVARRAVADAAQRRARGLRGKVAINLTAEDVRHEHVLEFLCDRDERRWEHLDIELLETALADPTSVDGLERLAGHGYGVALDDFGTGYSSLSALHELPLSGVKIDRSFVQRLPSDLSAEALVGAVASMCTHLGIAVVAEGIETEAQAVAARQLGCTSGQGFLFHRPLPLDQLTGRPVTMPS